jgi:hypothetical protein
MKAESVGLPRLGTSLENLSIVHSGLPYFAIIPLAQKLRVVSKHI